MLFSRVNLPKSTRIILVAVIVSNIFVIYAVVSGLV